jgi:hypothetical protein
MPLRTTCFRLVGNYLHASGQRVDQLQEAWSQPGLEWVRLGHPEPTTEVAEVMAEADIVVGYGRTILEAMACGRPAYVHDHSGSDGWVTAETYERWKLTASPSDQRRVWINCAKISFAATPHSAVLVRT